MKLRTITFIICIFILIQSSLVAQGTQEKALSPQNTVSVDSSSPLSDLYQISLEDGMVSYTDSTGIRRQIKQHPQHVVVGYNSLLDQWYFAGGTALTKVRGTSNVPAAALHLTDLGSMLSLSLEAILQLNPDLVILNAALENQVDLAKRLRAMGIDVILIDARSHTYQSFIDTVQLFSTIIGTNDSNHALTATLEASVNKTLQKAQTQPIKPKVGILFTSSTNVFMETPQAQVGEMVSMLGGVNIINSDVKGSSDVRIPFNIEYLTQANPDCIFVSLMGDFETTKKAFESMLYTNKAFIGLDAFKNGTIYFVPKQYGIYKPNAAYADAFNYFYEKLYESK